MKNTAVPYRLCFRGFRLKINRIINVNPNVIFFFFFLLLKYYNIKPISFILIIILFFLPLPKSILNVIQKKKKKKETATYSLRHLSATSEIVFFLHNNTIVY